MRRTACLLVLGLALAGCGGRSGATSTVAVVAAPTTAAAPTTTAAPTRTAAAASTAAVAATTGEAPGPTGTPDALAALRTMRPLAPARLDMTMRTRFEASGDDPALARLGDISTVMTMQGVMGADGAGRIRMAVSAPAVGPKAPPALDTLTDGRHVWLRFDDVWYAIADDQADAARAASRPFADYGPIVGALREAAVVGEEEMDGVRVVHVRARLDGRSVGRTADATSSKMGLTGAGAGQAGMSRSMAAHALRDGTGEVWIAADGTVHRMRFDLGIDFAGALRDQGVPVPDGTRVEMHEVSDARSSPASAPAVEAPADAVPGRSYAEILRLWQAAQPKAA